MYIYNSHFFQFDIFCTVYYHFCTSTLDIVQMITIFVLRHSPPASPIPFIEKEGGINFPKYGCVGGGVCMKNFCWERMGERKGVVTLEIGELKKFSLVSGLVSSILYKKI